MCVCPFHQFENLCVSAVRICFHGAMEPGRRDSLGLRFRRRLAQALREAEAAAARPPATGTEGVALGGLSGDEAERDGFDDIWSAGCHQVEPLFAGEGPVPLDPLPSSSSTSPATTRLYFWKSGIHSHNEVIPKWPRRLHEFRIDGFKHFADKRKY